MIFFQMRFDTNHRLALEQDHPSPEIGTFRARGLKSAVYCISLKYKMAAIATRSERERVSYDILHNSAVRLLLVEHILKETQNLALTTIQFLAFCIRSANQPF